MPARADPPPTLESRLRGNDNAFGFLRLALAVFVLISHSFPLGGFGSDPVLGDRHEGVTLGSIAVVGFFGISGFLVTKSARRADLLQFGWRRILRIFPAYLVMLVITAVIIGPWLWHAAGRSAGAYWTTTYPGPLTYITHNWTLSVGQYQIHTLLAGTPWGSPLNGSIWTLRYEWRAYVLIAVLLAAGVLRRSPWLIVGIAGCFVALSAVHAGDPAMTRNLPLYLGDPFTLQLLTPFLVGAVLACYAGRIPIDDRLGLISGPAIVAALHWGVFAVIGSPVLVYFVVWLAVRLPAPLRRVGARNDYSYGIYIYGFLMQQLLAYGDVQRFGYPAYLAASIVAAALCGIASWHLVEKQALRLKMWGPGRGFGPLRALCVARLRVRSRGCVRPQRSPSSTTPVGTGAQGIGWH